MGEDKRLAAAQSFWENKDQKPAQQQVEQLLAQRVHARPVFIKRLPAAKKAAYLVRDMAHVPYLWDAVMISYHFAHHRQMLADFLNAVGIPNENGHYEAAAEIQPPTQEAADAAVATLLEKYAREDVAVYLSAIVVQDPDFWKPVKAKAEELLPKPVPSS